jgi:hypothetical protein
MMEYAQDVISFAPVSGLLVNYRSIARHPMQPNAKCSTCKTLERPVASGIGYHVPGVACLCSVRSFIKRIWSKRVGIWTDPKLRTTDLSTRVSGANRIYTPDLATVQG